MFGCCEYKQNEVMLAFWMLPFHHGEKDMKQSGLECLLQTLPQKCVRTSTGRHYRRSSYPYHCSGAATWIAFLTIFLLWDLRNVTVSWLRFSHGNTLRLLQREWKWRARKFGLQIAHLENHRQSCICVCWCVSPTNLMDQSERRCLKCQRIRKCLA